MIKIIGVRFRNVGKVYYFDPKALDIKMGDHVIVETARGVEYGMVVLGPKEVEESRIVQPLKEVIRVATPKDKSKDCLLYTSLGERSRGVLDAGASSCCIILTSMADGILSVLSE